jgi:hypothetical protein
MNPEHPLSTQTVVLELRQFALELRSLAYTAPAGHEDKFIALSERMNRRANTFGHQL